MRLIKNLFTVPVGETVTEKHFRRVLIASVCSILLCMSCLAGTTWAWFTTTLTVENEIYMGVVDILATVEEDQTESVTQLQRGTHTVTLKNAGNAAGYCDITVTNRGDKKQTILRSQVIDPDAEDTPYTFTLVLGQNADISVASFWEELPAVNAEQTDETEVPVIYIKAGDTVAVGAEIYTVTYQADLEGVEDVTAIVNAKDYFKLPECMFEAPEGKKFQHWIIDEQTYAAGTHYALSDDATFTAVWTDADAAYTVTFAANGGSGTMDAATNISGSYTLPECTFTAPEGQVFKAWQIGTAEYAPGTAVTITENTTVTALWQAASTEEPAAEYTVTFDANGGTAVSAATTINQKLSALPETSLDGHTFDGWFTAAEGGEQITADHTYTADTTLYAHWTAVVETVNYTVTYSDGTNETTETVAAGTAITLADAPAAPEGSVFKAWNIGGTDYQPGASYTVSADTTVTAQWEAASQPESEEASAINEEDDTDTEENQTDTGEETG